MATIALYQGKINQMPSLIKAAKQSVESLKTELSSLSKKAAKVDAAVCDMSEVISSVETCTKTQENRIEALDSFQTKLDEYVNDAVRIDNKVAETVNKNKKDFYEKYDYLKPDCEKTFLDRLKDLGEWCKEHWKVLATIAIVIASVAVIIASGGTALGAAAPLLLTLAKGALVGTVLGGVSGGVINTLLGGSFWEGVEDGAFSGAITGLLSGGIGYGLSGGGKIALTLGKTILSGTISSGGTSLLANLGDILIAGKEISFGEVTSDFLITSFFGGVFAAGGYYLNRLFSRIPSLTRGRTTGRGSWSHVWKTQLARSLAHHTTVSHKTIMKGIGASIIDEIGDMIASPFNDLFSNAVDNHVGD